MRKNNMLPCLTTKSISKSLSGKPLVIVNGRIRGLTPIEVFLLMGFEKSDFDRLVDAGISQNQVAKQGGNSIVVNVLYYILLEIHKTMPYLLEDIKLSSFFSGIGAFEKAIVKLQETVNS